MIKRDGNARTGRLRVRACHRLGLKPRLNHLRCERCARVVVKATTTAPVTAPRTTCAPVRVIVSDEVCHEVVRKFGCPIVPSISEAQARRTACLSWLRKGETVPDVIGAACGDRVLTHAPSSVTRVVVEVLQLCPSVAYERVARELTTPPGPERGNGSRTDNGHCWSRYCRSR